MAFTPTHDKQHTHDPDGGPQAQERKINLEAQLLDSQGK